MDKNAIKKYAVWARRELISRVSQRAALYEITEKGYGDANAVSVLGRVMSADEKSQRGALIAQIREKGYEQVMEEIAYTWFNRFIALRFMEVNGYLPSHVRVFTDEENRFKPQILTEAINVELDGLDMEKVYALKTANDDDTLFKYLIIVQCNALSSILPGMFQRISDYTELLFPDNLLREGSVIEQMVSMIPEEDWTDQVQIIGWLYQYYNTEPKDKVFADLKKNIKISKENIPAATQLFTPDWIVRYMVENSLGRLWLEGHPNDKLRAGWKYYLDEAEQEPEVQKQLAEIRKEYAALKPEEIKVIDPCCGSGHILAYMFDVLVQIYEAYGYSAREAVAGIVGNNIWGLDIDDRAAQLAYFSVMMKARQYDRRFFSRGIQPHVYAIVESNGISNDVLEYFAGSDLSAYYSGRDVPPLLNDIISITNDLRDAKEYGSIINVRKVDFDALFARFEEIRSGKAYELLSLEAIHSLLPMVEVAQTLEQKYQVVVTNPPYMGAGGMSNKIANFAKDNYPNSKSDLFAVCMERFIQMVCTHGFCSMVTMQSWMFLSSFEKMRTELINNYSLTTLLHMDNGVMGIAFGTSVSVFRKLRLQASIATFNQVKLEDIRDDIPISFPIKNNRNSTMSPSSFRQIPGSPVAYWVSDNVYRSFSHMKIEQLTISDGQNITGNNDQYLRNHWEVSSNCIGRGKKWVLCARGGAYRKWYGNIEEVINWSDTARTFYRCNSIARIVPEYLWFREGFSWSRITSYKPSFRVLTGDWLFEKTGVSLFLQNDAQRPWLLGYLNSIVAEYFLRVITQVVSIQVRDIRSLPYNKEAIESNSVIAEKVNENITLSKEEWDAFETSWYFQRHPLLPTFADEQNRSAKIEMRYQMWADQCKHRFDKLKTNEEALNRIFIEIYGLQDELTPEVEDKDVTVRKADLQRDIKSLISYAVGCMFGRYSLDEPGLAYAGGEWDASKYQTFIPDKDAILPICDDEYFEDDIVGRFVKFVETVYGKDTLEENLRFIADALGGKGSSREVIRNYFINDFYADHLKVYQKRPIYWLFDSGKKNGFKCLIYMHRYQPDTIARIRTDYVHEQQSRYRTAIADLESRIAGAGTGERVKLSKQLTKLQDQAEELRVYEEKIHHLADQMIKIDLDDGVKVNYAKFQDVLAKIK